MRIIRIIEMLKFLKDKKSQEMSTRHNQHVNFHETKKSTNIKINFYYKN